MGFEELLPLAMFATLAVLLFTGFPVAFVLGGVGLGYALLALPVMIERGYDPRLSTGTIAASGTLGILIPPSIMLVIMADLLGRSVGNLFVAAVFPGLMLASLYVVYIVVRCTLNPALAPKLDKDIGPQTLGPILVMVLRSFIPPVLLIMAVLGSILMGLATPTEAAGVGALGAILLGLFNLVILPAMGVQDYQMFVAGEEGPKEVARIGFGQRLKDFWAVVGDVMERTAMTNAMIFGLFMGATMFSFVFRSLGGDDIIIELVESLGLGSWGLLFLLMSIVFVLGFFFDWIEITLIVLPVFAPIIELLDFGDHVAKVDMVYWFAILLAVNLQTSFLTPPFGFALFYMKAVAPPSIKIQQIYAGIVPFVLLQLFGLLMIIIFPEIALWLPRVLLN